MAMGIYGRRNLTEVNGKKRAGEVYREKCYGM